MQDRLARRDNGIQSIYKKIESDESVYERRVSVKPRGREGIRERSDRDGETKESVQRKTSK